MVLKQSAPSAVVLAEPFWLLSHRTRFMESLAGNDYADHTIYVYRRLTGFLCAEAEARGLGPDETNPIVIEGLAKGCPQVVAVSTKMAMATVVRRFTGYLVDAGVIGPAAPPPPAPGSPEELCEELEHWLRRHRGICSRSLMFHRNILKQLMSYWCTSTGTADDLASLTAGDVFAFLASASGKPGWKRDFLRNILRFLFQSGRIPHDLFAAVPGRSRKGSDNRPRHLEPDAIWKLLEAIRSDGRCGLRNYPMFLLMARLGLRAKEVLAMRLDDIDWRAGRILVRGKGGQHDYMPLPVDVGEAVVDWLRHGRKGNSRNLFVSVKAPYSSFDRPDILYLVLLKAYRKAGLTPPRERAGTRVLRHGLAMKLLGQGASLEEIGNVLRHRCAQSTTVYARHNIAALRPLARPWPVPGGVQ